VVEGQVGELIAAVRPDIVKLGKVESLDLVWHKRIGRVPRESRRKITDLEVLGFLYLDLQERFTALRDDLERWEDEQP